MVVNVIVSEEKIFLLFLEDHMSLRNEINSAMKEAMKEKAQLRLSTLRLINAAIKDRDIAARAEGG